MFLYTSNPAQSANTDCPENAMLLRRDLHKLWDMHRFSIVPKQGHWVLHILNCTQTTELQDQYHNRMLQPIKGVSREFLLARFALAVLDDLSLFVKKPLERRLVLSDDNGPQVVTLSAPDCYDRFGKPSKSRSQSPQKRSRSTRDTESQQENIADTHAVWARQQLGEECDIGSSDDEDWPQEPRGRPLKRRCFGKAHANESPVPSLIDSSFETVDSAATDSDDREIDVGDTAGGAPAKPRRDDALVARRVLKLG